MEAARRPLILGVGTAVVLSLLMPATAPAESSREVRALARAAETSQSALARLRAVTSVDGRPLRLAPLLATSNPDVLHARLAALAAGGASSTPAGDPARAAQSILDERRFRGSSVPRPFHGFVVWLGRRVRPVTRAVHAIGRHVPGGGWVLWPVLAGLVVAASAIAAARTAKRRGVALAEGRVRAERAHLLDPHELEREADAAEARGDAETAVRLRFRAGLLRLGRAEVVPLRDSLTTREARRLVASPDFDAIARTHDALAYGGRSARAEDAVDARLGWTRVLAAKARGRG